MSGCLALTILAVLADEVLHLFLLELSICHLVRDLEAFLVGTVLAQQCVEAGVDPCVLTRVRVETSMIRTAIQRTRQALRPVMAAAALCGTPGMFSETMRSCLLQADRHACCRHATYRGCQGESLSL